MADAGLVGGLITVGVVGAGLLVQGISNSRRVPRRMEELARRRQGVLVGATSAFPAVEFEADGARVTVRPDGVFLPLRARWTAFLADPGVEFRLFSRRSAIVVSRRVTTGDPDFDGKFLLEASDPDAVRRVWGVAARANMVEHFAEARMTGERGRLELRVAADFKESDLLVSGVDLLLRMARADPHGLRLLRGLAGVRQGAESGGPPGVALDGPGGIWIGPEWLDGRAFTRARGDVAAAIAPGKVRIEDGDMVGRASAADRLPADARRNLRALGTARVEWTEREVRIGWPEIETDPDRLHAAVALLRAIARPPSTGVFR